MNSFFPWGLCHCFSGIAESKLTISEMGRGQQGLCVRQGLERFLENGSCEPAADQDAVCHACVSSPVDWGPVGV